jgi:hypothetical protein
MKAASERQFIRILHLVLSIPIVGYIYGPVASIPQAVRFTRWVAMPVVVLTGFWLWLKPRLLKWPRQSGGAAQTLLSLTALFSLMSSTAIAQSPVLSVGDAFPYFSAQTVMGKPLVLPEAASGKTALVIFTFGRSSGKDGKTWNLRLAKDFQNPVPNYTIIVAESVPKMFQGRALSGIKSGMPQEMQNRAVLQLQDEQKWRTILGVKDDQHAYVLLLKPDGHIGWRNASAFSDSDYALVRSQLIAR